MKTSVNLKCASILFFILCLLDSCNSKLICLSPRSDAYACVGGNQAVNPRFEDMEKSVFNLQWNDYKRITSQTFPSDTSIIMINQDIPFEVDANALNHLNTSLQILFLKGVKFNFDERFVPLNHLVYLKTLGISVETGQIRKPMDQLMETVYERLNISYLHAKSLRNLHHLVMVLRENVAVPVDEEDLRQHIAEIAGSLKGKNTGNSTVKERLVLKNPFLPSETARYLEDLYLIGNGIADIRRDAVDELESIISLHLSYNLMDEVPEGVRKLIQKGTLKTLRMDHNYVSALTKESFPGSCSLTYIDFTSNDIKSIEQDVFQKCSNLASVVLENNPSLVCIPTLTFAPLAHGSQQINLFLDNTGVGTLEFTRAIPSLYQLAIANTNIACSCALENLHEEMGEGVTGSCLWGSRELLINSTDLDLLWEVAGCEIAHVDANITKLMLGTPCQVELKGEEQGLQIGAAKEPPLVIATCLGLRTAACMPLILFFWALASTFTV